MKAGKILILALCIGWFLGVNNITEAKTNRPFKQTNFCKSDLFCSGLTPISCNLSQPKKEVASAVVIAAPKENLPTLTFNGSIATEGAQVNADVVFELINKFRSSQGLPPFEREDKLCSLALARSAELSNELANGTLHSGLYNRNLPYWITEDAKVGSDEQGTVEWWLNSPIHHAAIVGNSKYSCGACSGNRCSQLFTSYTPK